MLPAVAQGGQKRGEETSSNSGAVTCPQGLPRGENLRVEIDGLEKKHGTRRRTLSLQERSVY